MTKQQDIMVHKHRRNHLLFKKNIKLTLSLCGMVIMSLFFNIFSFAQGEKINTIPKNMTKVDMNISFFNIEKTKKVEAIPLPPPLKFLETKRGYRNVERRNKQILQKYCWEREMRIDFVLKNVTFNSHTQDSMGKNEYKIFSIKWPIYNLNGVETYTGRLRFPGVLIYSSLRNEKILLDGIGYNFLQKPQTVKMGRGNNEIIDRFIVEDLTFEEFKSKMAVDNILVSKNILPNNKPYNLEGYCIYQGSIISAKRNASWYPFDKYIVDLFIEFPFNETDLNFKVGKIENFEILVNSKSKKESENLIIGKNNEVPIEIILKRKNGNIYLLFILAPIFLGLLSLLSKIGYSVHKRWIAYIVAFCGIIAVTWPPEGIMIFYPIRCGLLLFAAFFAVIIEYVYYRRRNN